MWDATRDGASGVLTACIEVQALVAGAVTSVATTTEVIGNEPPTLAEADVDGGTRDTIVLRFRLTDSSGDPVGVRPSTSSRATTTCASDPSRC